MCKQTLREYRQVKFCTVSPNPKKKLPKSVTLCINNQSFTEENSIRYLGIDSNLNWKSHINYIAKKVQRSIGTLSKLRYYPRKPRIEKS